ncbi:MAG: energy transducer TonB [Rhodanobacter sp.]
MSSANLAVAARVNIVPRPHLDSARIAAISAAIALNLAVILIASRPLTPIRLSPLQPTSPPQTIRFVDPPPVLPPPPPPTDLIPFPDAPLAPPSAVRSTPVSPPAVEPTSEGLTAAPPVTTPIAVDGDASPMAPTKAVPVEASLAYRSAPLRFPTRALQQRMHGTVLLRVLVDEHGKPLQVTVENGSGYALLDRSAVSQVLAGWRFQPAMIDGKAVRAWARVPVSFELH